MPVVSSNQFQEEESDAAAAATTAAAAAATAARSQGTKLDIKDVLQTVETVIFKCQIKYYAAIFNDDLSVPFCERNKSAYGRRRRERVYDLSFQNRHVTSICICLGLRLY